MTRIFFILSILLSTFQLLAQEQIKPLRIGYYSPFGLNKGVQLSTIFAINTNDSKANVKVNWNLAPRIAYFNLPDIQKNIQIGIDVEVGNFRSEKRMYSFLSLGMGYLISFVKYDGIVDLGTGALNHNLKHKHSILPQINAGLGWNVKNGNGLYLKLFMGRELSLQNVDATVIGGELGVQINIKT